MYNRWGFLLRDMNEATWISADRLQSFSQATVNRGAPYANIFGFVDGTIRPICRSSNDQREFYSGQKRLHGLKFQSVETSRGIIAHLF